MLAAGALLVAIAVFRGQRRREDFELARSLHADLTGGDVAQARDWLGTLVRSEAPLGPDEKQETMTAYFTSLWCFERIEIGRQTLATKSSKRASKFPIDSIRWHVEEWEKTLPKARLLLTDDDKGPDDKDSTQALKELTKAVQDSSAANARRASGRS